MLCYVKVTVSSEMSSYHIGFARITKEGFISFYDQASCFVNLCQKGVGRASGSPWKITSDNRFL